MMRSILGVVAGGIAWMVGFYVLAILLGLLWPDYAVHARQWIKEGIFTMTAPMAGCTLAIWALDEVGAGWVAAKISRRRAAVWVLAGLLGIYLMTLHFVLLWVRFPWWYNLGVVIPAIPAVLWGARLANPLPASRLA